MASRLEERAAALMQAEANRALQKLVWAAFSALDAEDEAARGGNSITKLRATTNRAVIVLTAAFKDRCKSPTIDKATELVTGFVLQPLKKTSSDNALPMVRFSANFAAQCLQRCGELLSQLPTHRIFPVQREVNLWRRAIFGHGGRSIGDVCNFKPRHLAKAFVAEAQRVLVAVPLWGDALHLRAVEYMTQVFRSLLACGSSSRQDKVSSAHRADTQLLVCCLRHGVGADEEAHVLIAALLFLCADQHHR